MSICSVSVSRPVLAIVLMLLVIVFGAIGLSRMPVREFPDIDVPMISISTNYDGASAGSSVKPKSQRSSSPTIRKKP